MSKSKTNIIVFCVTFVYFFIEALIHYNIGKDGEKFVFPKWKELCKIIGTILIFSFLTTFTISFIQKYIKRKSKK